MSIHLERQFDRLKKLILSQGARVEEALVEAIMAVQNYDEALARRVIENDKQIDLMEIEVEEECLHTLALHQPVAFDLRYVVAVLKINNDLERIADLASNICQQAIYLSQSGGLAEIPFDMRTMSVKVSDMMKLALDALVNVDPETAQSVRDMDDEVDAIHQDMYGSITAAIRENPHLIEQLIHYMNISRQLERIGDHACNIAEDVLYMARGDISRHQGPVRSPKT